MGKVVTDIEVVFLEMNENNSYLTIYNTNPDKCKNNLTKDKKMLTNKQNSLMKNETFNEELRIHTH